MMENRDGGVTYIPAPEFYDLNRGRLGWLGRGAYYKALSAGQIPCIRLGRKFLVREDAVEVMAGEQVG